MAAKHKCSTKIRGAYRDVSGPVYPCRRPATVQRDGQWYCWQHDPKYVKAKVSKQRKQWQAEMDREAAKYALVARNARLGALVTPELPALLERLAIWDVQAPRTTSERDAARALAARIREALAQEMNDAKDS